MLCNLSLDDHDVDYWLRVADVVEPYGARITCFITVANVLDRRNDICDLALRGHEMAAHAWTHKVLTTIPETEWRHEVLDVSDWIEQLTGFKVRSFAMPYGQTNEKLRKFLRDSGRFTGARIVGNRLQPIAGMDLFDVPVMDRNLLKGDGGEIDVRINSLKQLSACAGLQAPFLFYSHDDRNMTVNQIRWVIDELAKEGHKFITFGDLLKGIADDTRDAH